MEKDKIIAIFLIAGLIFLLISFVGVVAVTGFVFLFVIDENQDPAITNPNPAPNPNPDPIPNPTPTPTPNPNPNPVPTVPVCGDGEINGNEICEANSDCGENQECQSCQCVNVEPEEPDNLLEGIEIEDIVYTFICVEFDGETGLAASSITLKNNNADDYEFDGSIKVESWIENSRIDRVNLTSSEFSIPAGQTRSVYLTQTGRQEKYLFLTGEPATIKYILKFGNKQVEKEITLTNNEIPNNC